MTDQDIIREIVDGLIRNRVALCWLLSKARGLVTAPEVKSELARLVPVTKPMPNLDRKVSVFLRLTGNVDAELVSAVFACPIQDAIASLQRLGANLAPLDCSPK